MQPLTVADSRVATCAAPDRAPPPPRRLTATSFETPGSSMVTPYSRSAISIVRLLCVIRMNCERSVISRTIWLKRPTLASSSGASTSSSMQNGDGLTRKMANSSDTAVSAFSPPDSSSMFWLTFLPGGLAMISMPVSSMSLVVGQHAGWRLAAAEHAREHLLELAR